ncbi:hypothetical protein D3C72_2000650 [compost metagenome]
MARARRHAPVRQAGGRQIENGGIGLRQRRRHGKQQGRQGVDQVQPSLVRVDGFHHAMRHQAQGVMAAVNRQHVRQVAVGIRIGVALARRRDLPGQGPLLRLDTRRQVQLLDGVGQRRTVGVMGFVADGELHQAARGTRKSRLTRLPRS